jgi:hypothetical protein
MDAKYLKSLKGKDNAELSQIKASAAAALEQNTGDTEARDLVAAINRLFEERGQDDGGGKLRVRAKNFITVDGVVFSKDQEGVITLRQYGALACNFEKLAAALLLLGCLFFASPALAQQYTALPLSVTNDVARTTFTVDGSTGTNNALLAASTTTFKTIIGATKYNDIGIQITLLKVSSNTEAVGFNFDFSADGTNWVAQPIINLTPITGPVVTTLTTNLTLGSFGYVRFVSATNGAIACTNLCIKVANKPSRNGS